MFNLVYVDDILIMPSSSTEIQNLITQLNAAFSLKDLGNLNYFLDIEVRQRSDKLRLSQTKYISDLVNKANMDRANALPTTMVSNLSLPSKHGTLSLFLKRIGALLEHYNTL